MAEYMKTPKYINVEIYLWDINTKMKDTIRMEEKGIWYHTIHTKERLMGIYWMLDSIQGHP